MHDVLVVAVIFACDVKELADCMAGDKRIGGEEQRLLAGLIENKHPGVMIAYNNYASTQVRYLTD